MANCSFQPIKAPYIIFTFIMFLLSPIFSLNTHAFFFSPTFLLLFKYDYLKGFNCFNLPLSVLVNIYQSIIMTVSSKTGRWILMSSLSS